MKRDVHTEPVYIYATSEISKYYGITRKGLDFYEEKGLIAPARHINGKYREYSLTDCYHMYFTKLYRNCGLRLDQLRGLINGGSLQDIEAKIEKQAQTIEEEAEYKKKLSQKLQQIAEKLRGLPASADSFRVENRPEMYRLYVRNYIGPHESSAGQSREFSLWNKHVPINVASLRYPHDAVNAEQEYINNIILAEDFRFLKLQISKRVQHLPSMRCLHALLCIQPNELFSPKPLQPALTFIRNRGLKLTGDPVTAMLGIAVVGGVEIRYDEAWLPVGEE